MLSIIEELAKIIDMRKKSCIYVGLRKFKDTVRNRSPGKFEIGAWQKKPARIEVRSRQIQASRIRKPPARLTIDGGRSLHV